LESARLSLLLWCPFGLFPFVMIPAWYSSYRATNDSNLIIFIPLLTIEGPWTLVLVMRFTRILSTNSLPLTLLCDVPHIIEELLMRLLQDKINGSLLDTIIREAGLSSAGLYRYLNQWWDELRRSRASLTSGN
jgi:hypothetical protein